MHKYIFTQKFKISLAKIRNIIIHGHITTVSSKCLPVFGIGVPRSLIMSWPISVLDDEGQGRCSVKVKANS